MIQQPNIVFVFADEWRAQATGYGGDPNCETPVLDRLAEQSVSVTHAVAGTPVCCPYRASLMTGQYPLTHGVYINDVELSSDCMSLARVFGGAGYDTAYIGKWHLYGSPEGRCERRGTPVPRSHQLGFDYWKGWECSHDYHNSRYTFNDYPEVRTWEGYDAFAQSREAARYIRDHAEGEKPFLMMLSWGPPHFPLDSAPEAYRKRYQDRQIKLRPNVPKLCKTQATEDLRGYYAHIAALDDCLDIVLTAVRETGIEDNTIVVFTSDHGDMRGSQGLETKLFPWNESIRVPFLLRWPALHGEAGRDLAIPLDAPDIMTTLLGLCEIATPDTVEGRDWSPFFRGECDPTGDESALLSMPVESTELRENGMKAYRGLYTGRYTYVRNTDGPWLLYDNKTDPCQLNNLIDRAAASGLQAQLEARLQERLAERNDEFLEGRAYLERDGLAHYREVNMPCRQLWTDPWNVDAATSPRSKNR